MSAGDPTIPNPSSILPTLYLQTRNTDGTYNAPTTGRLTTAQWTDSASVHGVLRYQLRAGITGLYLTPEVNHKNIQDWGWGTSAFTEWTDSGYSYARSISDMRVWQRRCFLRLRVEVAP
jgi:hypothetical protein